jgi:hypothetical protein
MYRNQEQILIIYSVEGTASDDLSVVKESIRNFSKSNPAVRVKPAIFEIPQGSAPGATLGTELANELTFSIGAVVFVDDLKPNVAYELGFFHGQGRTVLLLTRKRVDSIWFSISDLAGAALSYLDEVDIETAVHSYLDRLYNEMSLVKSWPTLPLPSAEMNLLKDFKKTNQDAKFIDDGPYGTSLTINSWSALDFPIGYNVLPGAKFMLMLRASAQGAEYTIYFLVRFSDRFGVCRTTWLGLTSYYRVAGLTHAERTFPAQKATEDWRVLRAEYDQLLKHGFILGTNSVEFIEKMRFRAGRRNEATPVPIEVGFLSIIGVDR